VETLKHFLVSFLIFALSIAHPVRASYDPVLVKGAYGCLYTLTSDASTTTSVEATLSGWTKVFDNGGGAANGLWYNSGVSTSNFVVPVTGTYLVTLVVPWAGGAASNRFECAVKLNGTNYGRANSGRRNTTDYYSNALVLVIKCTAADVLTFFAIQNSGSTCTVKAGGVGSGSGTTIGGCYVGLALMTGQ